MGQGRVPKQPTIDYAAANQQVRSGWQSDITFSCPTVITGLWWSKPSIYPGYRDDRWKHTDKRPIPSHRVWWGMLEPRAVNELRG